MSILEDFPAYIYKAALGNAFVLNVILQIIIIIIRFHLNFTQLLLPGLLAME